MWWSEHSRDATSYKINHTINTDSQFLPQSCKKRGFFYGDHQTVACDIKIFSVNDNNKRGRISHMIRKYITVGQETLQGDNQILSKKSLKAELYIFLRNFSTKIFITTKIIHHAQMWHVKEIGVYHN